MKRTALALCESISPRLRPYFVAEAVTLITTSLGLTLSDHLRLCISSAAMLGVASGFIGYYGVLFLHVMATGLKPLRVQAIQWSRIVACARTLIVEMGAAEVLDTVLISPLLLYICYQWLLDKYAAVLLSESLGTMAFYAMVLAIQRLRNSDS